MGDRARRSGRANPLGNNFRRETITPSNEPTVSSEDPKQHSIRRIAETLEELQSTIDAHMLDLEAQHNSLRRSQRYRCGPFRRPAIPTFSPPQPQATSLSSSPPVSSPPAPSPPSSPPLNHLPLVASALFQTYRVIPRETQRSHNRDPMDESSLPDSLQLPFMQFDSSSAASSDTSHAPDLEPLNASEPESFEVPIMLDVASFREFANPMDVPSPYELLRPDRFEPDPTHPNPFLAPPARTIDHDPMTEHESSEDPIVDATSVRAFSNFTNATSPYELLQPNTFKPETIRRGSSSTAAMRTIKRDLMVEPESFEVSVMPDVSSVRASPNSEDVFSPDELLRPDGFDPDPVHPNSPSAPPAKSMDHGTMTEPFMVPWTDHPVTPPMSAKSTGVVASIAVPLSPNSAGFYTDAATHYFKLADHHSNIAIRHSNLAVEDSSISAHHSAAAAHHSNLRTRYSDLGIQYSGLMGDLSRLSTGPETLNFPPLVSESALASPTHISTLPADNNVPVSQHQPAVTQTQLEPSQGASVEHETAHSQPIPEGVVPYSPGSMDPARPLQQQVLVAIPVNQLEPFSTPGVLQPNQLTSSMALTELGPLVATDHSIRAGGNMRSISQNQLHRSNNLASSVSAFSSDMVNLSGSPGAAVPAPALSSPARTLPPSELGSPVATISTALPGSARGTINVLCQLALITPEEFSGLVIPPASTPRSGWNSLRYPLSQDLVDGSATNRRLRRAMSLPRFSPNPLVGPIPSAVVSPTLSVQPSSPPMLGTLQVVNNEAGVILSGEEVVSNSLLLGDISESGLSRSSQEISPEHGEEMRTPNGGNTNGVRRPGPRFMIDGACD